MPNIILITFVCHNLFFLHYILKICFSFLQHLTIYCIAYFSRSFGANIFFPSTSLYIRLREFYKTVPKLRQRELISMILLLRAFDGYSWQFKSFQSESNSKIIELCSINDIYVC